MPTRNEHHNGDHGKIQKNEDGLAPSMLPKASVPSELGSKDQSLASRLSRSGTRSARRIAAVLRSPSSKRLTPRRLRQLGVVSVASIRVRCRIGSANHLLHMLASASFYPGPFTPLRKPPRCPVSETMTTATASMGRRYPGKTSPSFSWVFL